MRRVYGDAVDEVVAKISSAGVETLVRKTDRQGSVVGLVNGSGTPVETIVYDGFGKVTSHSAPGATDVALQGRAWARPVAHRTERDLACSVASDYGNFRLTGPSRDGRSSP